MITLHQVHNAHGQLTYSGPRPPTAPLPPGHTRRTVLLVDSPADQRVSGVFTVHVGPLGDVLRRGFRQRWILERVAATAAQRLADGGAIGTSPLSHAHAEDVARRALRPF